MLTMEPMHKGDRRIIVCVQEGNYAASTAHHNVSRVNSAYMTYVYVHTVYSLHTLYWSKYISL